jgi:hypothetical protein
MKNRTNLFLAPYTVASGTSFISKKKEQRFSRKSHQKTYLLDPGSEKSHPGSGSQIQGVKKHRIPDPDPQH